MGRISGDAVLNLVVQYPRLVIFQPFFQLYPLLGGSSHLGYVVNNHGDRKSPTDRVMGPLPNGLTSWLINGGDPNHVSKSWHDPPSS